MNDNIAINLDNVSKRFKRGHKLLLKEALLDFFRPTRQEDFWALKNISFKVKKGEALGIIGTNGSGKSTVLKLIAGVLSPTKGTISVNGRIGPLIELGAGFHPELTGRENIYLNGTILGLSIKEINEKFNAIVNFSGLDDFIDTPVKHYSSGMYMRLGFSIAVHVEPDILLVDEILAVGDAGFQKKCLEKMKEFHDKGVTIIIISHSADLIKSFCKKAILINHGKIVVIDSVEKVINKYSKLIDG
ncbi:MAG: ABC transporter ATP-binding protein [Candidatus Daviesbacteria bacterium]|nr:ABC transporter ATP-binding protein [Candidatus Daviesbacteria bacterium]